MIGEANAAGFRAGSKRFGDLCWLLEPSILEKRDTTK